MYRVLRCLLFCLPAEFAHRLVLFCVDYLYPRFRVNRVRQFLPREPVEAFGLLFPNPVGLAAGLDKNGRHIDALFGLGFGFVEVGAVTPRAQSGNPKPRLFRLLRQQALINRMGFNNQGVDALVRRLKQRRIKGIVGVNIGKNRTTPLANAAEDYQVCYKKLAPYADFITINISSPNTRDLRELQGQDYLPDLLRGLKQLQQNSCHHTPILVKVSPDLTDAEIDMMASVFLTCEIDGIIVANTTNNRSEVSSHPRSRETGGLSGRPLRERTGQLVRLFADKTDHKIPIIAVGGIFCVEDVKALLSAGACLVQLYTGLIYQGPGLVKSIIKGLST